jgi:ABC-type multidrug transport system ATPase subunit
MCTHVLEIAQKLAGRICIVNDGKILALDTFENLQKKDNAVKDGSGRDLESIYLNLTGGLGGSFLPDDI